MGKEQIQSAAFRNAELHSEQLRIFVVLAFFAVSVGVLRAEETIRAARNSGLADIITWLYETVNAPMEPNSRTASPQ